MHQSRKKERHRRGQRVATREVGGQLRAQQPRIAARDHDPAALTLQPVELDFGSLDVFSGVMVVSKPFAKKDAGPFSPPDVSHTFTVPYRLRCWLGECCLPIRHCRGSRSALLELFKSAVT